MVAGATAAGAAPPPAAKKPPPPPKPRAVPKLNDAQKTGKQPVHSFAQLAALLKGKAGPADGGPGGEPKPDAPPAG